jgi:hypothetical protein
LPEALGIAFEPHDSSYWGEYYHARRGDYGDYGDYEEEFTLMDNYNLMEEDWNEPDFQQYPLLLNVSISDTTLDRAKELEERLKQVIEKVVLLRRNVYQSENEWISIEVSINGY